MPLGVINTSRVCRLDYFDMTENRQKITDN